MEYVYKGEKYPAAWLRGYGKGKSCYLSMGHEPASFTNKCFGNLLRRAALWCVGEL
jgi:type 1 glutamine amidotransferase